MQILSWVRGPLADGRLGANLIAVYGFIVFIVIASLGLRRALRRGDGRVAQWPGMQWLERLRGEASRHAGRLLSRLTIVLVGCVIVGGLAYHLTGRDARDDFSAWYARLTVSDLFTLVLRAAGVAAVLVTGWAAVRLLRRLRPAWEAYLVRWFGRSETEAPLQKWLALLGLYVEMAARLATAGGVVLAVGGRGWLLTAIGVVFAVGSILCGARLASLAGPVFVRLITERGDRALGSGAALLYWERIKRLLPFGQRCFEAAVYVWAAAQCVHILHFVPVVHDFGEQLVKCIGILFATRVLIELLHVLLHQAFGLYETDGTEDQKGRTLVPLLYSMCQYVLYFGSALIMLGVLGMNTAPILAGAGILGLAVGLGAQSLVTDVVSGFFILFENQYLVGDFVQIGDAAGIVEAVGIRLTQIRDGFGKLYIIPNGQVKSVVNYSKGYVNAVVDVRVPSGSDLEKVFRAMAEAGQRLRQTRREVLADTEIQGLVELGTAEMTVRAVTRVRPGSHLPMQYEYRRLLKLAFDQAAATAKNVQAA